MKIKVWGPADRSGPRARKRSATAATPRASTSPSPTARCCPRCRNRHPQPRPRARRRADALHILLTHLHLDHIQGLMFFAPAFHPETEIMIWGPASPEASLRDRIARYISAPLSPVEVRELPCDVSFREPGDRVGDRPARIRAESVTHRGPTLGYRIDDGEQLARLHPRPRAGPRRRLDGARGGLDLRLRARPRRLDPHPRRPVHRRGVPRAPRLGPLAALRTRSPSPGARRPSALLFHHDPLHSDEFLDRLGGEARARWAELGGARGRGRARPPRAPSTTCRSTGQSPPPAPRPPKRSSRYAAVDARDSPDRRGRRALKPVRAALEMAREAHAGQIWNASGGRAYIDHAVAVAERLAGKELADGVLAAALLHDVGEEKRGRGRSASRERSTRGSPSWSRRSPTPKRSRPTSAATRSRSALDVVAAGDEALSNQPVGLLEARPAPRPCGAARRPGPGGRRRA